MKEVIIDVLLAALSLIVFFGVLDVCDSIALAFAVAAVTYSIVFLLVEIHERLTEIRNRSYGKS